MQKRFRQSVSRYHMNAHRALVWCVNFTISGSSMPRNATMSLAHLAHIIHIVHIVLAMTQLRPCAFASYNKASAAQ